MSTVADYIVILGGEFSLPSFKGSVGGPTHIVPSAELKFELPADVSPTGILSWIVATSKGDDDGIDLSYTIPGYSWNIHSAVYYGLQLPIHGLKAGKNKITFTMTKGGKVTLPDPDENIAGGKGKLRIGQVCLFYARTK